MHHRKARWAMLISLSTGTMLATSTCDAVYQTVALAFNIVDVWV